MSTVSSFVSSYWPSAAAFALFGLLHSIGAQEPWKNLLARCTSRFFVDHFWRLIYCALSFWALYYAVASLHWARNLENDVWLIAYPDWLWQIVTVMHLASIGLIYVAFLQSDYLEFLGFKQTYRGLLALLGRVQTESDMKLFGTHRLEVRGVYAFVRHPMMVGGLLFLLTSGPSLNNIVYTVLYAAYMVLGGYYEERRMLRVFGDDYRRYQARVGAFIPYLGRRTRA